MNNWIYDLETFFDIFCGVFYNTETLETKVFEISSRKNEWEDLKEFLMSDGLKLIGFNNVAFDWPVLDKMLKFDYLTSELIHEIAQEIINQENSSIYEPIVPQLDLYLIHHYNNSARSCSLKWLEFSLRWHKVQDLPFGPHDSIPQDKFDEVITYCKNDVYFSYELFKLSENQIKFRINMSEKLQHNVMNYSDVKIGEYINRKTYEQLSGKHYNSFKDKRTHRSSYKLKEIIEDDIEFQTDYLKEFLKQLKNKTFYTDDDKIIDKSLDFANNVFTFKKGGLHSEDSPRIVRASKGNYLVEKDVASYYPASIVNSRLFPEHLGIEWYNGVSNMFNRRTNEIKPLMKTLDKSSKEYKELDTEQAGIKLSLNGGIFGKLGSEYSWQYDPLQKYKITINCELKLLMLIEKFNLNNITIHSANTDGVVIEYSQKQKELVSKIHKWWENKFNYVLEDTYYNQIIFSSVNDYIAEIIDPITGSISKIKYKGDFEIDKEWHKNNSQRIVPIALSKYFLEGIPVKETIMNHNDIYDFCIGRKARGSKYWITTREEPIEIKDKVIRYYISNNQQKLFKKSHSGKSKGTLSAVNKGFYVTMFMDYEEKSNYNINYDYYINECMKIIKPIEKKIKTFKQLDLFNI